MNNLNIVEAHRCAFQTLGVDITLLLGCLERQQYSECISECQQHSECISECQQHSDCKWECQQHSECISECQQHSESISEYQQHSDCKWECQQHSECISGESAWNNVYHSTLKKKVRLHFSVSPSHCILTMDQPIPAPPLQCQASGRAATRALDRGGGQTWKDPVAAQSLVHRNITAESVPSDSGPGI